MSEQTILIADDSLAQRKVLSHVLQQEGINVVEAEDGNVAIEKYKAYAPCLTILDLVMPNCGGKEALRKIIELDADANVIIASSLGGESDVEDCLRIGAKSYVQKPYDFANLLEQIRQQCD